MNSIIYAVLAAASLFAGIFINSYSGYIRSAWLRRFSNNKKHAPVPVSVKAQRFPKDKQNRYGK